MARHARGVCRPDDIMRRVIDEIGRNIVPNGPADRLAGLQPEEKAIGEGRIGRMAWPSRNRS